MFGCSMTKADRIEQINQQIVQLIIKANRLARYTGNWTEEEKLLKQREELDKQIKKIEQEK